MSGVVPAASRGQGDPYERDGIVRFRILGPLEVWSGQAWSGISARKWRALLATLLLNPGQAVSMDRLIDELWGDEPPARATNLIAVYVLKLRRATGDPDGRVLVTRAPGYQLLLGPGDLDADLFAGLVTEGRQALAAGAADRASVLLTEALGLYRGQPLADVPPSELVLAEAARLEESRVVALGLRSEAEIDCGRAAGAVADLRRLTTDHPLREELWVLLMRALHAAGRQAEALGAYEQARKVIAGQLGVDPGPELRRLHQQILDADASPVAVVAQPLGQIPPPRTETPQPAQQAQLTSPASPASPASPVSSASSVSSASPAPTFPPASPSPSPSPPSQLPADIPDFTGRAGHVKHLCDLLADVPDDDDGSGAVVVSLVAGAGGLGKTTLAVHAAHRLRGRFPDGQLYVSLHGASDQPAAATDVLARFVRELGVAGAQIPVSEEERAALYRTRLAGRRVLIVLDDARDAAQVRSLLPGTASCGVLVTSRNRLPDLAGGRLVDLDVLDDDEARALLVRIVGAQRLEAEPDATAQVLRACAGLPLAIRIAGARLATRTGWTIQTLARRLADEHRRIDEFTVGDLAVRASFQVSFGSLPAVGAGGVDPARAFRLLGLWPGPSISLPAAAALLGAPVDEVADALELLVDAHLLQSPAAERYRFHDLLRVYAAERANAEDPQEDRDVAIRRVLTWYLHTAAAADRAISPHRERVPLGPVPPGSALPAFAGVSDALDWCEAERASLVAASRGAAEYGLHDIAWKLPVAAMAFFNRRGYLAEWITTHRIALASARLAGDLQAEAWVLNNLGIAFSQQRNEDAIGHFEQAMAIRHEAGDQRGEAQAANNLAFTYELLSRFDEAIGPLLAAVDIQRKIGHRYGEATTLCNLGEAYLELGRVSDAIGCIEDALAIAREIGSRRVEAYATYNLARAYLGLERDEEAISLHQQALVMHRTIGDRYGEAHGLKHLGRAQRHAGRPGDARESWLRAEVIFRELGDRGEAAELETQLIELSPEIRDG